MTADKQTTLYNNCLACKNTHTINPKDDHYKTKRQYYKE